ncbi:MAG: metalloregulator ArsR/SmtB family transcription factor [Chloroflexota bacterium]|nr:metalloregulator ArsR/SmtB family transcription factor [Dehalococcoidia bacterium]MDW8253183.1 metalloregulator ArsR/SmtB family transcription factor [Chloroflexota bacterium]
MAEHFGIDGRALRDNEQTRRLADIFKALGDPTRIALLHLLSRGELNVSQLARAVGAEESISAISHHLRVLRAANLVRDRREGKQVYYRIADHHIVGRLNELLVRTHVVKELPR